MKERVGQGVKGCRSDLLEGIFACSRSRSGADSYSYEYEHYVLQSSAAGARVERMMP